MSLPDRAPSSAAPSSAGPRPDAALADADGVPPEPFPGDTHWYDLPDDDAAPEEDEEDEDGAGARWRPWRSLGRRLG